MKVFYLILFMCVSVLGSHRFQNPNVDISPEDSSLKRIELKDRVRELENLVDTHQTAHELYKKDAQEVRQKLQDEYDQRQRLQKNYVEMQKQKEDGERSLSHKIKVLEVRLEELEKVEDLLVKERDTLRAKIEKDLMQCLHVNNHDSKYSHKQYKQMQKVIDTLYDQLYRSQEICNEKLEQSNHKQQKQKDQVAQVSKKLKNVKKVVLELQRQKKVIKKQQQENEQLGIDLNHANRAIAGLERELVDLYKRLDEMKSEQKKLHSLVQQFKEREASLHDAIKVLQEERDQSRETFASFMQREKTSKEEREQLSDALRNLQNKNRDLAAKNLSLEMEKIELKTQIKQCSEMYHGIKLRK